MFFYYAFQQRTNGVFLIYLSLQSDHNGSVVSVEHVRRRHREDIIIPVERNDFNESSAKQIEFERGPSHANIACVRFTSRLFIRSIRRRRRTCAGFVLRFFFFN